MPILIGMMALAGVLAAETASGGAALDAVDPLIGTEGQGTQYGGMMPSTGVPFGSFHLVPMTRINGIGRLSFNQADKTLLGFILTRQPAIWMGDWGAVRVPVTPAPIERAQYSPYVGRVSAAGRQYEYTATAHAAWIRGSVGEIYIPNGYGTGRDDAHLGYELPNFRGWRYVRHVGGTNLQIGVSLVSLEQARSNLEREIGDKTFETVAAEVRESWEDYFSRVTIEAPEDVRKIFYTGLFHTLLYPRQIGEYGRYYSAFDDRIHEGDAYTCFSLWDTYRAEHPWLTLVAPERVDGMMRSLLATYREGGWLPKWPNPSYTGIMIGAPAEVVLAEAFVKGFRGFDLNLAYEAVRKNATCPQFGDRTCDWRDRGEFGRHPETRGGLSRYQELGYVACDETRESVSRTQDFGLGDRAAAILAEATGHGADARRFRERSRNYTNLWDAATERFLPRRADGTFLTAREANATDRHYCEQSADTAIWAVPFDTDNLMKILGGRERAIRRLDDFFDRLFFRPDGRGNRSIHGNEPSHHCAYLYNRFGCPEKTQRRVREILTRCYSTNRKGFDGNEDCGQMSAWYLLSALGFYPLDPASGEYEIGSPIVRSAVIRFGAPYPAATLRLTVRNYAPDRWRVKRVTLNGRELGNWRVRHADLVKGGELVFEMQGEDVGAQPVRGREIAVPDAPFAMPAIPECAFPPRDFPIADYGAVPDGSPATAAIRRAMEACHAAGGGRVVIPEGRWTTGAIWLKSNCCLRLARGAVLEFSDDPDDYPVVETAWEGVECLNLSPLIRAYRVENVGISGPGRIEPRMRRWRDWFARPPAHERATELLYHWGATNAPMSVRNVAAIKGANVRPPLIEFNQARNVLLEDFAVRESPFWTIHLYRSENCVARNLDLRAHGHNNDGIDVDMTRNVLIEKCRFDQGDDGVCLKAGRNRDAWRIGRPTENVVVRDCEFLHAQSMLGIGSELSGGIRNVWVTRCRAKTGLMGLRIKTNRRRGGFVENVWMDHCAFGSVHWLFGLQTDVLYQWARFPDYERRFTRIANVSVSDVSCKWAEIGIKIRGDWHLPPTGLSFADIRFDTVVDRLSDIKNCGGVKMSGVECGQSPDAVQPQYGSLPIAGKLAESTPERALAAAFVNRLKNSGVQDGTYELGKGVVATVGPEMMRPVAGATYWTDPDHDTLIAWPDPKTRERFWVGDDKLEMSCGTGGYAFIPAGIPCADRLVYANTNFCRRVVVKIRQSPLMGEGVR